MLKVKLGRPAVGHIIPMLPTLGLRINRSNVKVIIVTMASFYRLYKSSGMTFLVIYLKGCQSLLQQYLGGHRIRDTGSFGARISRTHSGCPTIIPALHRQRIRSGDIPIIKLWMTLFALYRVLDCRRKLNLKSITAESTMPDWLIGRFSEFVTKHFTYAIGQFPQTDPSLKNIDMARVRGANWSSINFMKGIRGLPFMISSSSPSSQPGSFPVNAQATSPFNLIASSINWLESPLWPYFRNWLTMTHCNWMVNRIESWGKHKWWVAPDIGQGTLPLSKDSPPGPFEPVAWLGRLGFKLESAGKIRVFAMVDPFTQWALNGLHLAIFGLLTKVPQDGTFDQLSPIYKLLEWKRDQEVGKSCVPLYSFDLSSATDRIPIVLQKVLLSPFLGSWGAELWSILLVGREYRSGRTLTVGKGKQKQVFSLGDGRSVYRTGQPMGALSSWAMLAFIHHAFVQYAAFQAGQLSLRNSWYKGYAILGDDVVIAGKAVARRYQDLMALMGVEIGLHKSVMSGSGRCLEFAKRTFYNGVDVSPTPFREFVVARRSLTALLEFIGKYPLTLGEFLTVLGYGYKAKAAASTRVVNLNRRLRGYVLSYYSPASPNSVGLFRWLSMKSINTFYSSALFRVQSLAKRLFESEILRIRERLEILMPYYEAAKLLTRVYRDADHYREEGASSPGRQVSRGGVSPEVPRGVIDSINETVYRESFFLLEDQLRDLKTKLEEPIADVLHWDAVVELWTFLENFEKDLGAMPRLDNIHSRPGITIPKTGLNSLKKWYRYSGLFRSTDTNLDDKLA